MTPLKQYAHELLAYLNPNLGLFVQFEATDEQVAIADQAFDDFRIPESIEDREEKNAFVGLARLIVCWERWKESRAMMRPGVRTNAGEAFQDAVHQLTRAILPPIERWAEPMHELHAQRDPPISMEQIAKMHKLRTPDGRPDVDRVRRELASGVEKCYRYCEKRLLLDLTGEYEQARESLSRLLEKRTVARRIEVPAERPPAPESYSALAKLPGMKLGQIAKMKRVSLDEAEAELSKLGLIVDGMSSVLSRTSAEVQAEPPKDDRLRFATSIRESTKAGFDPEKSVKANVQKLASKGYSAAQIEQTYLDQTGQSPPMEEIAEHLPETVGA